MAGKPQDTTDVVTPEDHAAQETQDTNGTAGGMNWAEIDEPIFMPSKTVTTAVTANVLETVPEQVRARAEASLRHNTKARAMVAGSTAKRARVLYRWDFQPVKGEQMAAAFDRLITRYAKYRPNIDGIPFAHADSPRGQVTARTGAPGWFTRTDDGRFVPCGSSDDGAVYGLRYSVRPFEQRNDTARLPGTE